jgi:hypothetical protein
MTSRPESSGPRRWQGRVRPGDQSSLEKFVGGQWEGEKGKHCKCLLCGEMTLTISPNAKGGWMVFCNNRQCLPGLIKQVRQLRHLAEFRKHGLSMGTRAKPRRRRRPVELPPVDVNALLKLKDADRRVLIDLATAADGSAGWFERTHREINAACHVSTRHTSAILNKLKAVKMLEVASNKYRAKRATKIRFLVDPASVLKPGQTDHMPNSVKEDTCLPTEDNMERRVAPTYGVYLRRSVDY